MDVFSDQETGYMLRALELGARGEGRTSPNPPVGCVLVRGDAIIAEGWHDRYGGLHAETMALASLKPGEAAGSTAYVTLSPCASHGKQPPCADALAAAGVREVVAASLDPNPKNASGLKRLAELGIPSRHGLLEAEAEYLARGFFSNHQTGRPYVTLKYAMTLDGKIATATGDSRWISCPESREVVQDIRSRADAIMVGIGTATIDNPLLNVREPTLSRRSICGPHPQPLRIVVDSHCRLSPKAAMLNEESASGGKVIVATLDGEKSPRGKILAATGAEVLSIPALRGKVCLKELLAEIGRRHVNTVLCEGGGALAAGLLAEEMVDEAIVFVAPKVVGGSRSPGPVGELGIARIADAKHFTLRDSVRIGDDIMLMATMITSRT